MLLTPDPAPYAFVTQSDQSIPSASILPAQVCDERARSGMSYSNMGVSEALLKTTTSRTFQWNPA
jgi:hypothetical protein